MPIDACQQVASVPDLGTGRGTGLTGCGSTAALALLVMLAGCAIGDGPDVVSPKAGLKCVDDSPVCIAERQMALKSLMADPSRSWIRERPDASAYASGVRLFAFKKNKKELTCPELQAGRLEADSAPAALRAPGTGLSPAQISRSVILAGEIGRELGSEYQRRCRKT